VLSAPDLGGTCIHLTLPYPHASARLHRARGSGGCACAPPMCACCLPRSPSPHSHSHFTLAPCPCTLCPRALPMRTPAALPRTLCKCAHAYPCRAACKEGVSAAGGRAGASTPLAQGCSHLPSWHASAPCHAPASHPSSCAGQRRPRMAARPCACHPLPSPPPRPLPAHLHQPWLRPPVQVNPLCPTVTAACAVCGQARVCKCRRLQFGSWSHTLRTPS
jgi:hypothetical protein